MSIVSPKLRASAGHYNAYYTVQVAGVCPDATTAKTESRTRSVKGD